MCQEDGKQGATQNAVAEGDEDNPLQDADMTDVSEEKPQEENPMQEGSA
jgi:hypothetical protein